MPPALPPIPIELFHDIGLQTRRAEVQEVLRAMQAAWPDDEPAELPSQLLTGRYYAGRLGYAGKPSPQDTLILLAGHSGRQRAATGPAVAAALVPA